MRLPLARWLGLTLLTVHAAACAPPDRGAAGRGATLVVGTARPAAVAWLDDGRGPHGAALAGAPEQLAAGPGGGVVALTADAAGGGRVALELVRPRGAAAPAVARRLSGLETSGRARLAADGRRYAVVSYQRRPDRPEDRPPAGPAARTEAARCPLLVVDLLSGASTPAPGPCRADETLRSLTLEAGGPDGEGLPAAFAYVGLAGARAGSEDGAGRLAMVALPSGAVVGSRALAGTPVDLRLGAGGRDAPAALYVLEQAGGAGGVVPTPERGRVVVLNPLTLDVVGEHALSAPASRLVPAPDGRSVFLVRDDTVWRLTLPTGTLRQLARLPGRIVAAEPLGERLYLGSPEAGTLWVVDTRSGLRQPDLHLRLLGPPISLAVAGR